MHIWSSKSSQNFECSFKMLKPFFYTLGHKNEPYPLNGLRWIFGFFYNYTFSVSKMGANYNNSLQYRKNDFMKTIPIYLHKKLLKINKKIFLLMSSPIMSHNL